MGQLKLSVQSEMRQLSCGECGIEFYVPQDWYDARSINKENGGAFTCPNGHTRVFRQTDIDRVRAELAQERQKLEQERRKSEMLRHEAEAERKRREKLQKRIRAGVCPCCKRSFVALGRHMKTKHPDFAAPKTKA